MWLTDRTFLQTHVTFCEYLVFHEFRRNLYITLAKYLEQEGIADLIFNFNFVKIFFYTQSSQILKQSHETRVVGYCMIFQTCFSLHPVQLIYLIFHSNQDHNELKTYHAFSQSEIV